MSNWIRTVKDVEKLNRIVGGLTQTLKSTPALCCANKPVYAKGLCRNCYEAWLRNNNPEFAERQRRNCKEWSKKYKEKARESNKKWLMKQDKNYRRIRRLREQYGLTLDDYNNILSKQGYKCAICGKPHKEEKKKRLHIDHDHTTGLIRGLLCFRCNFGLTYFSEDPEILFRAYTYLDKAKMKNKIVRRREDGK